MDCTRLESGQSWSVTVRRAHGDSRDRYALHLPLRCIATHRRGSGDGKHTTLPDHMPSSHRRYADWTIERIGREAGAIGPSVSILCTLILERRPHPEQGFRACLGILRLARSVPPGRLDAAAARAIEIGALTYGSVKSILDNKLDQLAAEPRAREHQPVRHRNIRGGGYFH